MSSVLNWGFVSGRVKQPFVSGRMSPGTSEIVLLNISPGRLGFKNIRNDHARLLTSQSLRSTK